MDIGEIRHRITIQNLSTEINENGFEVEQWCHYKTVWAAVTNLHGREYYAAAAINAQNTVKFTIRYIEDIENSMRILFKGKTYNITSIDNIKYRNQYIEIKAVVVENG